MPTVELTGENLETLVSANDTVVIDFWASWCGPCRTFAPVFEKVASERSELLFAKVDTETQQELAAAFNIMSIPTLMIIREGVVIYAEPGAMPEQALNQLVDRAKALDMVQVHRTIAEESACGQ